MTRTARHPAVIGLAPNGASKQKCDHPAIPLSKRELVATAVEACAAGVTLLHLHIRTATGAHSLDPDIYVDTMRAIRRAVGDQLVIQATTESMGLYSPPQQIAAVKAMHPEAVTVALRELVPDAASESRAAAFFHWLAAENILAQVIVYAPAELAHYYHWLQRGLIPAHGHSLLFVLGRYPAPPAGTDLLAGFVDRWQANADWMVCGFGAHEYHHLERAVDTGGHIRVGFENSLVTRDGNMAGSNLDLIRQAKALLAGFDRPLADGRQTRRMLGAVDA